MGQGRFGCLSMLNIEKDIANSVNTEDIIDIWYIKIRCFETFDVFLFLLRVKKQNE